MIAQKKNIKVLIIGLTWPQPEATGAGIRMVQLISLLKSLGFSITFCSAAAIPESNGYPEIPGVVFEPVKLNHESFDRFLLSLRPDMVIFDRFLTEEYFGWRVATTLPNTLCVLDTEDLHSLRHAREFALQEDRSFEPALWRNMDITKRELASIFRSDLALIISRFEMEWLETHVPAIEPHLFYLPFLYKKTDFLPEARMKNFSDREDFIFIGNGRHSPNTDAILYLKREVWPEIRKQLPHAGVCIYGAHLSREITGLTDAKENFFVKGWVPEVSEVLNSARVSLLPLRFGAGLKGKLFEAIRCGTPSAMTSIAAEGTSFARMSDFIKDDPAELASIAVSLYRDEGLWVEWQKRGASILKRDFLREDFKKSFSSKLDFLFHHLEKHRDENLIGSILLHHTMASTRYLSKWIELKEAVAKKKRD
ncbi:glycosyltransferase [Muriicola marianensis]|uniref:Glycosyl transferase n=1 Tax=Muriicola marianensis TaxID=1324801 RepID=A0ABQ1QP01_9FLAO|nr:glycosyltransferase [Muriicola marianensis]GGD38864.1 glycosyl transferase [Muriicola marianensis]